MTCGALKRTRYPGVTVMPTPPMKLLIQPFRVGPRDQYIFEIVAVILNKTFKYNKHDMTYSQD